MRAGDVMRPGDHGFLAAVLLPGMRAVTVGVDAITGTAGLIWPGDRVDLILTQRSWNAACRSGHRVAAETVLTDVAGDRHRPAARPGAHSIGSEQPARTVTLEVDRDPGGARVRRDAARSAVAVR